MTKSLNSYFLLLIFHLYLVSCNQNPKPGREFDANALKEPLLKANILATSIEDQDIDDLIERYGWQMTKTGSGLRYMIYFDGSGPKPSEGDIVTIEYTLRSIIGDIIYSSEEGGPISFMLGKGGVESGLEEAIKLLKLGDKAKLVIPSHLGFGFTGDDHKIPPKTTLIYDVELIAIN